MPPLLVFTATAEDELRSLCQNLSPSLHHWLLDQVELACRHIQVIACTRPWMLRGLNNMLTVAFCRMYIQMDARQIFITGLWIEQNPAQKPWQSILLPSST